MLLQHSVLYDKIISFEETFSSDILLLLGVFFFMKNENIFINSDPSVKYITKTNFLPDENGEIQQVSEVEIFKYYHGQKQFWKVWLSDFLSALGLINNSKQLDVVFHILENTNPSDNTYIGTYRKTADDAGVSYQTVAIIVPKMVEAKMITKVQNGVYKVNPQLIMKGNDQKQRRLVVSYQNTENSANKSESFSSQI